MKRKALALILCLAVILTVALPGTLAVSMDTQTTTSTVTLGSKSKTDPQPTTEPPATTENAENTPQTPANQGESTNESTTQPTLPETTVPETTVPVVKTSNHNLPTCTDQCAAEDCACVCHLVAKLLATENVDAFFALADSVTQEQYAAMTQEQLARIDAHLEAIEPKPAPAIILDNNDAPVASEICTPTKNFTNVAPLGDPVTGK